MKISEKLKSSIREGNPTIRFAYPDPLLHGLLLVLSIFRRKQLRYLTEFHPGKVLTCSVQGLQNLYDRMERMATLGPQFIDVCL